MGKKGKAQERGGTSDGGEAVTLEKVGGDDILDSDDRKVELSASHTVMCG